MPLEPQDPKAQADLAIENIKRIQTALQGMTHGLKIEDLEAIAEVFADFAKQVGTIKPEEMKFMGENLREIANAALGLKNADNAKETISNIKTLMASTEDATTKSFLRR